MPVDLGDYYPITVETTDEAGDLVDVTSVSVVITLPTGTAGSPVAMSRTSLGRYELDYLTTTTGLHSWRATSTGAVEGNWSDTFVVESGKGIVSLADALAHLGWTTDPTPAQAEQLRSLILAATAACASFTGRTLARTVVTETHDGGRGALPLRQHPVISVTSVSEAGTAYSGFTFDPVGGIVWRDSGRWDTSARQSVSVTYVAGYEDPPADIRLAVLHTVEALWQRTQQAPHPALGSEVEDYLQSDSSVPPMVARRLLEPHRFAGIA